MTSDICRHVGALYLLYVYKAVETVVDFTVVNRATISSMDEGTDAGYFTEELRAYPVVSLTFLLVLCTFICI